MVEAMLMTEEKISEFIEMARSDPALWAALKDLEKEKFNPDGSGKVPSFPMLVDELVRRKYGPDHHYERGTLILRLRMLIGRELGLI